MLKTNLHKRYFSLFEQFWARLASKCKKRQNSFCLQNINVYQKRQIFMPSSYPFKNAEIILPKELCTPKTMTINNKRGITILIIFFCFLG
jgi:hypothetical protein